MNVTMMEQVRPPVLVVTEESDGKLSNKASDFKAQTGLSKRQPRTMLCLLQVPHPDTKKESPDWE
jgi:hypothetical protein